MGLKREGREKSYERERERERRERKCWNYLIKSKGENYIIIFKFRIVLQCNSIELHCSTIAKKFAILGFYQSGCGGDFGQKC